MQYHVAKNGEKSGPFEKEEIYRRLVSGELSGSDLGWCEGMAEWEPLSKLIPPPTTGAAPVFGPAVANVQIASAPQTSGLAIASMVCGILSFFSLGLTSLPAIIMGHMARSRIKKSTGAVGGGGMAVAGLITGYIGFFLFFVAILASLAVPVFNSVQRKGNQMKAVVNAKQIVLGMRQYAQDNNGSLPPSLETLYEQKILDDRRLLEVPGTRTPTTAETAWEYRGAGMTDSSSGNTIVLISRESYYKDERVVARLDGSVQVERGVH